MGILAKKWCPKSVIFQASTVLNELSESKTSAFRQSYPLHYGDLRPPQWTGGDGGRRPGHDERSRAETFGEEDPPPLPGQDPGRIRRVDSRRIQSFSTL